MNNILPTEEEAIQNLYRTLTIINLTPEEIAARDKASRQLDNFLQEEKSKVANILNANDEYTNEVLDFIAQFRELGAENCFSNGMCFWFARILKERFGFPYFPEIMYTQVDNHFGCLLANDRIYDITGDVTDKYNWEKWEKLQSKDKLLYERIVRDCVRKERYK